VPRSHLRKQKSRFRTLAEAGLAHGRDVLPIAMLHNGKLFLTPPANTVLHAGDTLIIVVPTSSFKIAKTK
jgi:K+/H+ antiporter YhaU regulatory subunit KhtT